MNAFEQKVDTGQMASATLHDGSNTVTGRLKPVKGFYVGAQYESSYPDRYTADLTQAACWTKNVPHRVRQAHQAAQICG